VWIFDTYKSTWKKLNPPLQIQGSTAGKKIRKAFEPRLAHTSVIIDSYVIVFGGLNSSRNSLISNDIYVLSLDNKTQKMIPEAKTKKSSTSRRKRPAIL